MKADEELTRLLEAIARRDCWSDDKRFCPNECADGNIDDAYWGGVKDGETRLAKDILGELGGEL